MKKLLTLLLMLFAVPAFAAEHAGSGNAATAETGWSGANFSALSASNVWAKRAYKADATILEGHSYKVTVTVSGYSGTGSVAAYVTGVKTSATGITENVTDGLNGQTAIGDNFNYANGLESVALESKEGDPNGSFRFGCMAPFYLPDDPMVFPGKPGMSHLHQFFGNSGGNGYSTYKSLRTTGGTTCGNSTYPINRSLYWTPAMLDGAGHVIPPFRSLVYYKGISRNFAECNAPLNGSGVPVPDSTHVGKCVTVPNGLKYIAGCDMGTMTGCPSSNFVWECREGSDANTVDPATINAGHPQGIYTSIDEVVDAGCPVGSILYESLQGPECWDGLHTDTPNHRDHMHERVGNISLNDPSDATLLAGVDPANRVWGQCPATHPYMIPSFSVQLWYKADANFFAKHWHLSSDENMGTAMLAGQTSHLDYMEGWSPTAKNTWQTYCEDQKNSSNQMELCDGTRVKGVAYIGTQGNSNSGVPIYPRTRVGWTRNINGNGTFTAELRAVSSGEFGLYGIGGFTASSVTLSVTDVTLVGKHLGVSGAK